MPMTSPTTALKEWAIAVDALTQGSTIMMLRKGGIREQAFAVAHSRVWLYPTYEHQKPHLLKSEYAHQVVPVESGWHPDIVPIQAWADITHVFEVFEEEAIAALLPFHIWNEAFVSERLKWKARLPLSILLLRVYRLPQPQPIPYRPEYGGCQSWIELQAELSSEMAKPVLTDDEYRERVEAIALLMKSVGNT